MILLAVETTSPTGSLCVAEIETGRANIRATRSWQKKSMHSEVITVELMSALDEGGLRLTDLTHAAVDVGPGSFTGIRVGLNLVRTLAYALDIPVGIASSLQVLGYQCLKSGQHSTIAIPAIQTFYYAASIRRTGDSIGLEGVVQSIDSSILSSLPKDQVQIPTEIPRAETLAMMAAADLKNLNFVAWKDVIPLYVRRSEAEEKLRKGLLKPTP